MFMNFNFQVLLIDCPFHLPISKSRILFSVMLVYKPINSTNSAAGLRLGTFSVVEEKQ